MRRAANKMTRIMRVQLQPLPPTKPRQILADKSASKCEWIKPLPSRKDTSYSSAQGKEKFRRKQNERSVREQARASLPWNETIDPIQADDPHSTAVESRGKPGRGNTDACSWLDLDRGRVLVLAVAGGEGGAVAG